MSRAWRLHLVVLLLAWAPWLLGADLKGGWVRLSGDTMSGALDMGNQLVTNIGAAGTDFTAGGGLTLASGQYLRLGGATSSFPSLVNSGATARVLLADGSDYAATEAGRIISQTVANGVRADLSSGDSRIGLGSSSSVLWNADVSGFSGAFDAGLARSAAGVARVSDGGAGFGGLIVGTADATGLGFGTMDLNISTGTGSPEGVVTADTGSLFLRTDGGAGTSLYVKETNDASNVGWVGK